METNILYIIGLLIIVYLIYKFHNERKEKARWDSLSEEQKDKELYVSIDEKSKQGLRDVLDQSEKTDTIEEQMQKLVNKSENINSNKSEQEKTFNKLYSDICKSILSKDFRERAIKVSAIQNKIGDNILLNPVVIKLKETFKSLKWLDTEDEQEFDKYILHGGGSQKIIEMMQDLDDMQKMVNVYNSYVDFKEKKKN